MRLAEAGTFNFGLITSEPFSIMDELETGSNSFAIFAPNLGAEFFGGVGTVLLFYFSIELLSIR